MEFRFETAYDREALMVMAQTLRKTVRRKRSHRSHCFGVVVIMLAVLLMLPLGEKEFALDLKTGVTCLAVAAILFTLLFEDRINGYIAGKRMLPGLHRAVVTFHPEGYHSETEIGSSDFKYSTVLLVAETADYFVFVFSQNHAQIYSKSSIAGGTVEEFRRFITDLTGKEVQKVH